MLLLFWLLRVVMVVLVVIMMMMVGLMPVLSVQRPSQLLVLQPDCLAALPCPPESWSDPPQILAPPSTDPGLKPLTCRFIRSSATPSILIFLMPYCVRS